MAKGIIRKLDNLGRIVIPIEIRRSFGIDTDDRVGISLDDRIIRIEALKEPHGMTRPVDRQGRIVPPKEIRNALGLKPFSKVDTYVDGNIICVEPVGCGFCGSGTHLIEVEGISVCLVCAHKIIKAVQDGDEL